MVRTRRGQATSAPADTTASTEDDKDTRCIENEVERPGTRTLTETTSSSSASNKTRKGRKRTKEEEEDNADAGEAKVDDATAAASTTKNDESTKATHPTRKRQKKSLSEKEKLPDSDIFDGDEEDEDDDKDDNAVNNGEEKTQTEETDPMKIPCEEGGMLYIPADEEEDAIPEKPWTDDFNIGDKVWVYFNQSVLYRGEITSKRFVWAKYPQYYIHYKEWGHAYDEWAARNICIADTPENRKLKERLFREMLEDEKRKKRKGATAKKGKETRKKIEKEVEKGQQKSSKKQEKSEGRKRGESSEATTQKAPTSSKVTYDGKPESPLAGDLVCLKNFAPQEGGFTDDSSSSFKIWPGIVVGEKDVNADTLHILTTKQGQASSLNSKPDLVKPLLISKFITDTEKRIVPVATDNVDPWPPSNSQLTDVLTSQVNGEQQTDVIDALYVANCLYEEKDLSKRLETALTSDTRILDQEQEENTEYNLKGRKQFSDELSWAKHLNSELSRVVVELDSEREPEMVLFKFIDRILAACAELVVSVALLRQCELIKTLNNLKKCSKTKPHMVKAAVRLKKMWQRKLRADQEQTVSTSVGSQDVVALQKLQTSEIRTHTTISSSQNTGHPEKSSTSRKDSTGMQQTDKKGKLSGGAMSLAEMVSSVKSGTGSISKPTGAINKNASKGSRISSSTKVPAQQPAFNYSQTKPVSSNKSYGSVKPVEDAKEAVSTKPTALSSENDTEQKKVKLEENIPKVQNVRPAEDEGFSYKLGLRASAGLKDRTRIGATETLHAFLIQRMFQIRVEDRMKEYHDPLANSSKRPPEGVKPYMTAHLARRLEICIFSKLVDSPTHSQTSINSYVSKAQEELSKIDVEELTVDYFLEPHKECFLAIEDEDMLPEDKIVRKRYNRAIGSVLAELSSADWVSKLSSESRFDLSRKRRERQRENIGTEYNKPGRPFSVSFWDDPDIRMDNGLVGTELMKTLQDPKACATLVLETPALREN